MQLRLFMVFAAALSLLFPGRGSTAQTLRSFVQKNLAQAPGNFSSVRSVRKDSDVYFVQYAVLPKVKSTCPGCSVNDEFAWTAHPENWYLEDRWNYSERWSTAKLTNYISGQLSPILKGYTLRKSGSTDYPTFKPKAPSNGN